MRKTFSVDQKKNNASVSVPAGGEKNYHGQ